ncbi:MAG: GNAT family N-acetyltransferase [Candidatus Micrarchaeales archaeon]
MRMRKAKPPDFQTLYKIGLSTPELKVSDNEAFMSRPDFKFAITNKNGLFLVAEKNGKIIGFAYCYIEGPEYACMVYDVVLPKYRGQGIGKRLIQEKELWLKKKGVKSAYALATNQKATSILKHLGYRKGKQLTWMEKKL